MGPARVSLKAVWVVPIVLLVVGLMLTPASAFLGAAFASGSHSSSSVAAPATSPASVSTATSGSATLGGVLTHTSTYAFAKEPQPTAGQASGTISALQNGISTLEQKNANPASIKMLESLLAGVESGRINPLAVQLPNINVLLGNGVSASPKAQVTPYYSATPAPMGIGDFGLGATPYELNTSAITGSVTLNNYNATGGSLYEDSGSYYWNGLAANSPGSPYDSGLQLNTVLQNVTYPGYEEAPLGSGVFWTQNVPEFFGPNLTFLDNVWNFSAPGASMVPGTLYSYDGVLVPYDFYYDYGPTIPVSFPMTLQTYNNASVNIFGQDVLTFGYRVTEGAKVYTGIYDTVVFNSEGGGYVLNPQFQINGYDNTPNGAFFDAEYVFCGPAAGSNAVVTNLTGSMYLAYLNSTSGKWMAPESAYDYGTNTGETAIGVAETWSGTTAYLSQGPSILYGFWNATYGTDVPSGAIKFVGTSNPNYAFTFIGLYNGTATVYPAYAPSNAAGTVTTLLPPTLPAPWTAYGLVASGDGYATLSTTFTGAQTNFAITLASSPHTLDAPLYMNGNAQAAALAGAVGGGATPPYTFSHLILKVDSNPGYTSSTFNVLNDWDYPTFNLVYEHGVTSPVSINAVSQGPNLGPDTVYSWPYFGGYLVNLPNASQQFVDYGGVGDNFSNLYLPCFFSPIGICLGGAISLWGTSDTTVSNIVATNGSFGVWASSAPGTTVKYAYANRGAAGFTVVASTGAVGWNLSSNNDGAGTYIMGGTGTFTYLNSTLDGTGAFAFWSNDSTFNQVNSNSSRGVELLGGIGNTLGPFTATNDSEGAYFFNAWGTTVGGGSVTDDSLGVYVYSGTAWTNISGVAAANQSTGVEVYTGAYTSVVGTSATNLTIGVEAYEAASLSVSGTTVSDAAVGVIIEDLTGATVSTTTVSDFAIGVIAADTSSSAINGVTATNTTLTPLYSAAGMRLLGIPMAAVDTLYNLGLTVTGVTATTYGAAMWDEDSSSMSVSNLNATSSQFAVVLNGTYNSLFTQLGSYKDWQGVVIQAGEEDEAYDNTITSSSFVDDTSYAVYCYYDAYDNLIWNNMFIGNNGATSTYSAAHIQAWSLDYNYFYYCANYNVCLTGTGNFWADWHTYGQNGYLAPYPITGAVFDNFPIGPQETFTVTFTETGLAGGTNWSVTFNGVTKSSTTSTITFQSTMGTYTYSLSGVDGYNLQSGTPGTVTLAGSPATVAVVYTSTDVPSVFDGVNSLFAIALALLIIAVLLALLLFVVWRRGHRQQQAKTQSSPPTAWTPPEGATGAAAGGAAAGGAAAGSGGSSWSEGGAPSGGSSSTPPPPPSN